MTTEQAYSKFIEQLTTIYEPRESANIADRAFENICHLKRVDRVINKQKEISNNEQHQLNEALEKLLKHVPIQYVLGETWFWKMRLKVNEYVLIPRPETEELVQWAVANVRSTMYDVRCGEPSTKESSTIKIEETHNIVHRTPYIAHVLDVGTGSGCISIALKKELPQSIITAIDVSGGALLVAKENATVQNALIDFQEVDFLNNENWDMLGSYDIIVSNPPYIPSSEKDKLDKNVSDHEPHTALFVNDEDAFIFYRSIAEFAVKHLLPNGKIFVELHEDFAAEIADVFQQHQFKTEIKKDIYKKERMLKAEK